MAREIFGAPYLNNTTVPLDNTYYNDFNNDNWYKWVLIVDQYQMAIISAPI